MHPAIPRGPVRLYWTRFADGAHQNELRVLTRAGARRVRVQLRLGEAPYRVTGYPGGVRMTLTLSRRAQPARGDILVFGPETGDSGTLTRLGESYPLGAAPSYQAPAWLGATRWVVLAPEGLRVYRVGCVGSAPPRVVRPARRLDVEALVDEGAWPLVPVDARSVLAMPSIAAVVRAKHLDASNATNFGARPRPYVSVDTRSGAASATHYVYSSSDAWFAVHPDVRYRRAIAARACR